MTLAISSAREWFLAQPAGTPKVSALRSLEVPPRLPQSLLTCNSDASSCSESTDAGLGWVIVASHDGKILEGQQVVCCVSSPLMAEALALREMLAAASRLPPPNVWIRSDSLKLIRVINLNTFLMELYGIFKDIEFLSASFDFIHFSHVPRSCNSRADSLAKNALLCAHSLLS
ncbi:hypothetical protein Bca52824_019832 [Brassica carinata]|uniref:RNase H type-1 domain-containing protein n=1 Tax=Brassica carinata TaxID=52824 RepID=A0A8X7VTU3_BRACI|nr:hypothetical protein Bca52824_019832 [Brassica carinata]